MESSPASVSGVSREREKGSPSSAAAPPALPFAQALARGLQSRVLGRAALLRARCGSGCGRGAAADLPLSGRRRGGRGAVVVGVVVGACGGGSPFDARIPLFLLLRLLSSISFSTNLPRCFRWIKVVERRVCLDVSRSAAAKAQASGKGGDLVGRQCRRLAGGDGRRRSMLFSRALFARRLALRARLGGGDVSCCWRHCATTDSSPSIRDRDGRRSFSSNARRESSFFVTSECFSGF